MAKHEKLTREQLKYLKEQIAAVNRVYAPDVKDTPAVAKARAIVDRFEKREGEKAARWRAQRRMDTQTALQAVHFGSPAEAIAAVARLQKRYRKFMT